jgi:nucleoid-associated protein YgaU
MSNGARLTAVIVVVAVAAIGLYFAIMSPATPAQNEAAPAVGSLTEPNPADGMGEIKGPEALDAGAGASAPPPQAFGEPSTSTAMTPPAANGPEMSAGATGTASSGAPTPTGGAATAIAAPTSPKRVVEATPVPPAGREYTIKSGDTLEGIARAELGDGQRWKQIVEMNPGLDPNSLKIGRKIMLPSGSGTSTAAKPASSEAPATASGNSYTVQKGDTLFGIARKVYGSATDADIKRIVDANSGTLKSKDTPLKPGMKLSVPAKR